MFLFGCEEKVLVNKCDIRLVTQSCIDVNATIGWGVTECKEIEKPYWIVYKKKSPNDKEEILYKQLETSSEEDKQKILQAKKDFCQN